MKNIIALLAISYFCANLCSKLSEIIFIQLTIWAKKVAKLIFGNSLVKIQFIVPFWFQKMIEI